MVYGVTQQGNHHGFMVCLLPSWFMVCLGRVTIMAYGFPGEGTHHGLSFAWGG